jgi:EAL domain-containing protein (putative c-di-GMP-specific phosphodiesterase class I)
MNCRSGYPPIQLIEDQGIVRFKPVNMQLVHLLQQQGMDTVITAECIVVPYSMREEMLNLLHFLRRVFKKNKTNFDISIAGLRENPNYRSWIPFIQIEEKLENQSVLDIIRHGQFTSHMQPIVDLREKVVGFEFLLRPPHGKETFQTYQLFEVARETGLHSFLDRLARNTAIETSALWLPNGYKRFINFLPSSLYDPEYCLSHTFHMIDRLNLDPKDFVFEVVETENIEHIPHLLHIFDMYRDKGISVALDDVGSGYSTVELMSDLKPDYVKIDRSLIDHCDQDWIKQREISKIVEAAFHFNAQVLAEGIERYEDFQFCIDAGIDLAQGYLFGKPAERPPEGIAI